MAKKHYRCDQVETLYAALHGRHIALETIRPTALEAAEANRRLNPSVDGFDPPAQIIEIKLGYNIDTNTEMPF